MNESLEAIDALSHLEFQNGTLTLDAWDREENQWRSLAFHYRTIEERWRTHLSKAKVGLIDHVPSWQSVSFSKQALHSLRTEQMSALDAWKATKHGMLIMPTGTGKTEVALHAIEQLRTSTLIVAPIRDLMYQWHRRILQALNYDAGIIGDNAFQVKPISVTTYESACIHMPKLGDRFRLLIFDECHHLPGEIRGDAARLSAAPFRMGLTATLSRTDFRYTTLCELIGPVVYELTLDSVRGKSLAEYEIVRIAVELKAEERKRYDQLASNIAMYVYERRQTDESFQWKDLYTEVADDPQANLVLKAHREKQAIEDRATEKLRVVEDLLALHHGMPIIIFAGSNAMAREVSLRCLIPCLLSHCGKKERLDYLDGLRDGVYPAIVANQILDEGVDIPAVKVAIVIGGMASDRQAQQRLGRILRKSGNERAILYEVVCQNTNEVKKSRVRRRNDAYARTRYLKNRRKDHCS
jgi:superfamily II DNA or RNA helicase